MPQPGGRGVAIIIEELLGFCLRAVCVDDDGRIGPLIINRIVVGVWLVCSEGGLMFDVASFGQRAHVCMGDPIYYRIVGEGKYE